MKFQPAEPHENLDVLRFISEEGKWEIGLRRMMFGVRVSMSRIGNQWYTLDYCGGADQGFILVLLATVVQILEQYPEDVTCAQLERDFPGYEIKPINLDPHCWSRLQEMAAAANHSPAVTESQ